MQDICPAAMPEIELPKDVFPVLGIPQLKRIGTDQWRHVTLILGGANLATA